MWRSGPATPPPISHTKPTRRIPVMDSACRQRAAVLNTIHSRFWDHFWHSECLPVVGGLRAGEPPYVAGGKCGIGAVNSLSTARWAHAQAKCAPCRAGNQAGAPPPAQSVPAPMYGGESGIAGAVCAGGITNVKESGRRVPVDKSGRLSTARSWTVAGSKNAPRGPGAQRGQVENRGASSRTG